jgi:hypothetical protein
MQEVCGCMFYDAFDISLFECCFDLVLWNYMWWYLHSNYTSIMHHVSVYAVCYFMIHIKIRFCLLKSFCRPIIWLSSHLGFSLIVFFCFFSIVW